MKNRNFFSYQCNNEQNDHRFHYNHSYCLTGCKWSKKIKGNIHIHCFSEILHQNCVPWCHCHQIIVNEKRQSSCISFIAFELELLFNTKTTNTKHIVFDEKLSHACVRHYKQTTSAHLYKVSVQNSNPKFGKEIRKEQNTKSGRNTQIK